MTGDFVAVGVPMFVSNPYVAVQFAGNAGYVGPSSDARLEGSAARSIEVWARNADIADEEPMVSWSRRFLGVGTMMSFNYGAHGLWGAATHWAAADVSWGNGGAPASNAWHHLAYTYDGTVVRVYADGSMKNEQTRALATQGGHTINLAMERAATNGGIGDFELFSTLAIAVVRVHAGELSAGQVQTNYDAEKSRFGL